MKPHRHSLRNAIWALVILCMEDNFLRHNNYTTSKEQIMTYLHVKQVLSVMQIIAVAVPAALIRCDITHRIRLIL